MGIVSRLIHRVTVTRITPADPFDVFGETTTATIAEEVPCYIQARREKTISETGKFYSIAAWTMWAARDADLEDNDVVSDVRNRRGIEVFPGANFRVNSDPLVRRTHTEAVLESYT